MRGVAYEWRADDFNDNGFENETKIGLIAQDVEEIIPELVKTNDHGYKSISYEKLTAVLVEAIKELSSKKDAEIENLKDHKNKKQIN